MPLLAVERPEQLDLWKEIRGRDLYHSIALFIETKDSLYALTIGLIVFVELEEVSSRTLGLFKPLSKSSIGGPLIFKTASGAGSMRSFKAENRQYSRRQDCLHTLERLICTSLI